MSWVAQVASLGARGILLTCQCTVQGMTRQMGLYLPEAQRHPLGRIARQVEVAPLSRRPCCTLQNFASTAHQRQCLHHSKPAVPVPHRLPSSHAALARATTACSACVGSGV